MFLNARHEHMLSLAALCPVCRFGIRMFKPPPVEPKGEKKNKVLENTGRDSSPRWFATQIMLGYAPPVLQVSLLLEPHVAGVEATRKEYGSPVQIHFARTPARQPSGNHRDRRGSSVHTLRSGPMFPLLVSKLEGPLGCVPIHISAYG